MRRSGTTLLQWVLVPLLLASGSAAAGNPHHAANYIGRMLLNGKGKGNDKSDGKCLAVGAECPSSTSNAAVARCCSGSLCMPAGSKNKCTACSPQPGCKTCKQECNPGARLLCDQCEDGWAKDAASGTCLECAPQANCRKSNNKKCLDARQGVGPLLVCDSCVKGYKKEEGLCRQKVDCRTQGTACLRYDDDDDCDSGLPAACEQCAGGYWNDHGTCKLVTKCGANEKVVVSPGPRNDRQCAPIASGPSCTAQNGCADSGSTCITVNGALKLVCNTPSPGHVLNPDTGAVVECTAQAGCANSGTACVTVNGVPKLVCNTPSPGHVVDDDTGAVVECTAQDGCADSDTACVTLGGVPKLVCGSPSPGYVVDDNTGAVEQCDLQDECADAVPNTENACVTLPGGATKAWCAAPEDGFLVTSGVVNQCPLQGNCADQGVNTDHACVDVGGGELRSWCDQADNGYTSNPYTGLVTECGAQTGCADAPPGDTAHACVDVGGSMLRWCVAASNGYTTSSGVVSQCAAQTGCADAQRDTSNACVVVGGSSYAWCGAPEPGYHVTGGIVSQCTAQSRCSASDSTAACVAAVDTTTPNKYFCTATTNPGYWVDSGVVKPCTAQPLCTNSDANAVCVAAVGSAVASSYACLSTNAPGYWVDGGVVKPCSKQAQCTTNASPQACLPEATWPGHVLRCATCQPGIRLSAEGICGCDLAGYWINTVNSKCTACTNPHGSKCAVAGATCNNYNHYLECLECKEYMWKDQDNQCMTCDHRFDAYCKPGLLLPRQCTAQNKYVMCTAGGCVDGAYLDSVGVCKPCTSQPYCVEDKPAECTSSNTLKCNRCKAGYYTNANGVCTTCSAQSRCASSDNTKDCVAAFGTTAVNRLFCSSTTTAGYYVAADGVVRPVGQR